MGKRLTTGPDAARSFVDETLAASGSTNWCELRGRFNFTLSGVWGGTATIERSFDGGTTASPCTDAGAAVAFTANLSELLDAGDEDGVLYRVTWTRTSGTLRARLSQ